MRCYAFPGAVAPDESVSKSEAANKSSAFIGPTVIGSATCGDGRVAIDVYSKVLYGRGSCMELGIIHSSHVLTLIEWRIPCTRECVIIGQNFIQSPYVPLYPRLRHLAFKLE